MLFSSCRTISGGNPPKQTHEESALFGYTYEQMVDYLARGGGIDDQDAHGYTMLNYFVTVKDYRAVEYLMERGADPDIPAFNGGGSPRSMVGNSGLTFMWLSGGINGLKIYRLFN